MEKSKGTENYHFYSREKSLYVAWARFRNDSAINIIVTLKESSGQFSIRFSA